MISIIINIFPTWGLRKLSCRDVAQPGRAQRSGRWGRWFKSSHPDQQPLIFLCPFFSCHISEPEIFQLIHADEGGSGLLPSDSAGSISDLLLILMPYVSVVQNGGTAVIIDIPAGKHPRLIRRKPRMSELANLILRNYAFISYVSLSA